MTTTRKTKPKPIELGVPPAIPPPKETIPPVRPEGELDALAANFQYLSDRVADVATRGDLPPNAHEFISRTQMAINNLATYTRKVKERDLKEYRRSLADHRISIILKVTGIALIAVFISVLFGSPNPSPSHVQPHQTPIPTGSAYGGSGANDLYPP